jgi:3-mercaptopropionate dioxygenase
MSADPMNSAEVLAGQEPKGAMTARGPVPDSLKRFIWDIQSMVELADSEREILVIGRDLMTRLVANDDWLPTAFAIPDPTRCQQFQLYHDDLERFAVVSTILADGQILPIMHDPVWEIVGVLRGSVERKRFSLPAAGAPEPKGASIVMQRGAVDTASAASGDAVQLGNALADSVSLLIHVYGGEIGSLMRRTCMPGGEIGEGNAAYANGEDGPPYDILSIQTRIAD